MVAAEGVKLSDEKGKAAAAAAKVPMGERLANYHRYGQKGRSWVA